VAIPQNQITERRRRFRALHRDGCFVVPNPWDVGSARYLQRLGFQALATTSAGASWSLGLPDGALSLEQVIAHVKALVEATDLPVNADLESGFAADAAGIARTVTMAIDAGAAAISIEDSSGSSRDPVRSLLSSVERIRAARATIDARAPDVLLVGRAENFFVGIPDLPDTVARLTAYAEAGADILYAPGVKTKAEIETLVTAVAPKPFNLLIGEDSDLRVADAAALGVRRISVGGALARVAWGGFMQAARSMATEGAFVFPRAASGKELNSVFAPYAPAR
jgi:2-methylisocitrate lyase-like PEP mutase family enzyme